MAKESECFFSLNSKKMTQIIHIFTSEIFGEIRTCQVNNQIMFVGKDVAQALGYAKPQNALAAHVDREDKSTAPIQGTAYDSLRSCHRPRRSSAGVIRKSPAGTSLRAISFCIICALCEEEVADGDAGDDAGEVGEETAGDGMAGLGDTYGTEIDGQNIERGVGGTLENAR